MKAFLYLYEFSKGYVCSQDLPARLCLCQCFAFLAVQTPVSSRAVGSAGGWELMENPERHHEGIAVLAG